MRTECNDVPKKEDGGEQKDVAPECNDVPRKDGRGGEENWEETEKYPQSFAFIMILVSVLSSLFLMALIILIITSITHITLVQTLNDDFLRIELSSRQLFRSYESF